MGPGRGPPLQPAKLLVDPYARGLDGEVAHTPHTYGHRVGPDLVGDPYGPADPRDSAGHVPFSVVVDTRDLPGPDPAANRPWTPWSHTVIYEAHVRGLTLLADKLPEELRGTYAGLAHPAVVDHLLGLGVTAIELLPVHAFADEPHLVEKGLTNYWGYSTLGFFAPHAPFATAAARAQGPAAVLAELRTAVHALHEAGLEVLLDVVYNHTCEGGLPGQHLSWRGLDSSVYYAHDGGAPATLADVTGTGNTLDFRRTEVVRMTLDSLRYWADVVGVDGFRFDLAVTLGRDPGGFSPDHPALVAIATEPALHGLKLVAEPWDVGPGGWRTGQFPVPFAEWNDRFRNAARSFWLADPGRAAHGLPGHRVRDLATRLSGSVDLFGHSDPPLVRGRARRSTTSPRTTASRWPTWWRTTTSTTRPTASSNRDGSDDNRSWNHGVEGSVDQDSPAVDIVPLRRRSIRNLFATLVLAAGTPMITAGDEMGRTQQGNNNAYCQDNELSWLRWDLTPWRKDLLATARWLLLLRREHPALRTERFYWAGPTCPVGARTSPGSTRSGCRSTTTAGTTRRSAPADGPHRAAARAGHRAAGDQRLARRGPPGPGRRPRRPVAPRVGLGLGEPGGGAGRGDRGRPARGAGRGDGGRGAQHAGLRPGAVGPSRAGWGAPSPSRPAAAVHPCASPVNSVQRKSAPGPSSIMAATRRRPAHRGARRDEHVGEVRERHAVRHGRANPTCSPVSST